MTDESVPAPAKTAGAPSAAGPTVGPVSGPVTRRVSGSGSGPVTRRVAIRGGLAATAVVAGGLAAGCTVGGSDDPASDAGSSGAGGAGDNGVIVALGDVPVGGAVAVTIDKKPAVVARPTEQSVAAFSARCTHQGCTVRVDGARLACPCHGSQFDALTGAVLRGPAERPLDPIQVRLDGDDVVTA